MVSGSPLDDLAVVAAELADLEARQAALVAVARQAGASWREIAQVLGVSPQAAHKRYRHARVDPDSGRVWREPPLPI
jgi:DNA-directed RNA polymerase specialized sigma24 family protein